MADDPAFRKKHKKKKIVPQRIPYAPRKPAQPIGISDPRRGVEDVGGKKIYTTVRKPEEHEARKEFRKGRGVGPSKGELAFQQLPGRETPSISPDLTPEEQQQMLADSGQEKPGFKDLIMGKPMPGSPQERLEQEAAEAGITPQQAQMEKISAATGLPAGWIENMGTLATVPLTSTMKTGQAIKGRWPKGFGKLTSFETRAFLKTLNPKSVSLLGKIWAQTSGKIALITGGAAAILGAIYTANIALGSIMLGMWSGTESPEGAMIPIGQKLYAEALRTQDPALWAKFDEYMALSTTLAEEANPELFKNQVQPWKQFQRKWKQTRIGMKALVDAAASARTGQTWEQIKQEEKEEAMMRQAEERAYYARLKEADIKASAANRAFWANLHEERQEYWKQYWENKANEMPSQLGFGLL